MIKSVTRLKHRRGLQSHHSFEMSQSKDHFHSRYYHPAFSLAPVSHLNPTRRHIPLEDKILLPETESKAPPHLKRRPGLVNVWRARDNRKGRHAVAVAPDFESHDATSTPIKSNSLRGTLRGLLKMFVRYPVWDVSYNTAILFTIGKQSNAGVRSRPKAPDTSKDPSYGY